MTVTGGDNHEGARLQRAVSGDAIALRVLLAQSRSDLCRYIHRKIVSDPSLMIDPEDIAQETHITVYRKLDTFSGTTEETFQRWIRTIALNRLRNAINRQRTIKRGGRRVVQNRGKRNSEDSTVELFWVLADPTTTPSRSVARKEAITAVQQALTHLPSQYQQVMRLVHIEGYSIKEVAQRLDRTEGSVRGLCRRGMKCLQERFTSASHYFSSTG